MGKNIRAIGILISAALCFASCAVAQTRVQSPLIIQRQSTTNTAGQAVFPNSANIDCIAANYATCSPLVIQHATIDATRVDKALEVFGSSTTNGNIVFNPGKVAGNASVHILSPNGNTSDPALILWNGGSGASSNGLLMKKRDGTSVFSLNMASGDVDLTALNSTVLNLKGSNGFGAPVVIENTGGTTGLKTETILPFTALTDNVGASLSRFNTFYGLTGNFSSGAVIGSSSGVAKLTSGTVGVVSGASSDCVVVNGTSTPCAGSPSDPAWTAYTPTVGVPSGGTATTSSVSAAYVNNGQSAKVRIFWFGTVSVNQSEIDFSLPVGYTPIGTAQVAASTAAVGASFVPVSALMPGTGASAGQVTVVRTDGGLFTSGTGLIFTINAVYELP